MTFDTTKPPAFDFWAHFGPASAETKIAAVPNPEPKADRYARFRKMRAQGKRT